MDLRKNKRIAYNPEAFSQSRGREFGLEFVRIRSEAQELLHQIVKGLENSASK